ncbi:extracellular solute-binding protein [Paenibacillus sp. TRM 82003]|nr:extracellular solute-binding protein [Paenibacillus sp. TRM 82003]
MNGDRTAMYALPALLAALLLLGGCGEAREQKGAAGTPKGERGEITMMANLHTPEVPSKTIERLLEERTGFDIEVQWTPDGSYEEKFNASMATDTLPEAVYLKNAAMLAQLRDPIRNGLFWEIGPLLDEYDNLRRLKPDVLGNSAVDGKIYGIYQERPLSRQGIVYRKDWADRLGIEAPRTIEQFREMLYRFTFDDPDGNGIQDTFGLADRSDLVYGAFKTIASYMGAPNGWGERDGELLPEFMFPEYVDTMNFFRELHRDGVMNRDFPVTAKADQIELFISGKAGVYVGAMGDVHSLQLKAMQIDPTAVFDVHNRIAGPAGERVWSTSGFGTVVLFPIASVQSEEELREVLSFFDRLMDPELANLIRWGIEGVHYTLHEGKAVPTDDIKLAEKDVKPYQGFEIGGPNTIEGFLDSDFSMASKDKAERLTVDNETMLVRDPTWPLDSPTFNERGMRLQEYIQDATYKYILGHIETAQFEAEVDRWLDEGGQAIIDEYNESYRNSK